MKYISLVVLSLSLFPTLSLARSGLRPIKPMTGTSNNPANSAFKPSPLPLAIQKLLPGFTEIAVLSPQATRAVSDTVKSGGEAQPIAEVVKHFPAMAEVLAGHGHSLKQINEWTSSLTAAVTQSVKEKWGEVAQSNITQLVKSVIDKPSENLGKLQEVRENCRL